MTRVWTNLNQLRSKQNNLHDLGTVNLITKISNKPCQCRSTDYCVADNLED